MNGFPQLFQLCSHFTQSHIPPWIAHVLKVGCLLAMTKLLGGICPITMGKTLYWFISHTLCFQFHNPFTTHFPPHQFRVATKRNYETIIHGIMCILYLHPNLVFFQLDVANAFNSVSRRVIFQELHVVKHYIIHPLCLCIWISPIL